ncbi:hypothetical protein D3C72_970200 [compost metagenome]
MFDPGVVLLPDSEAMKRTAMTSPSGTMSSTPRVFIDTDPPIPPAIALPIEGPFSMATWLMKSGSTKLRLLVP